MNLELEAVLVPIVTGVVVLRAIVWPIVPCEYLCQRTVARVADQLCHRSKDYAEGAQGQKRQSIFLQVIAALHSRARLNICGMRNFSRVAEF